MIRLKKELGKADTHANARVPVSPSPAIVISIAMVTPNQIQTPNKIVRYYVLWIVCELDEA